MADPVFDSNDRVAPPPVDLNGRTPQQIAQYYQERERNIVSQAQTAIANAGANGSAGNNGGSGSTTTAEQYERDPLGTTRDMINRDAVSRGEWNQMTGAVKANLVESAKRLAAEGKKYWARLLPTVEQYTASADDMAKLDPSFWTTAYNAALGASYATIQAEEQAAAAAATASAEAPSGGSTPPPAPRLLLAKELAICDGLGITPDQFRRGEENLRINKFPVTLDNRRR